MNMICPQCQKDDAIQKVSAVVAGGHTSGSFSGFSGSPVNINGKWHNTSSYTTLGGSSMSDLARLLAPPLEPRKQSAQASLVTQLILALLAISISCGCPVLLIGMLGFGQKFEFTSTAIRYIGNWTSCFLFLCLCLVLLVVFMIMARKERDKRNNEIETKYPVEKSQWENAMAMWNRLYYCHRDGIVFDPENNKTCQPSQLKEFIYG